MILYFYVTRQTIIRLDKNVIVSNSHEYIEGDLHFDRDWDDITAKYVVWERIDSTDPAIKIMLSDDGWDREMNLLLNSGTYRMSVHGLNRNDVWITTHPIEIEVLPTGGVDLSNLAEYLACDRVAAVGGSFMMKGDIRRNCRRILEVIG